MKRIVVLCATGLKNAGDEALLASLLSKFSCRRYRITAISFDPEYTKMHHRIEAVGFGGKKWREAVHACDLFIMGGGGLLQDETTVFNVYRWISKLRYAIKKKKRTLLYANSIGPLTYRLNRILVKETLKRVNHISLRDSISKDILLDLGIDSSKITITMDPVLGLNIPIPKIKVVDREKIKGKYVAVSLRHWYDTHPVIPVRLCTKYNIRTKKNRDNYERFVKEFADLVEGINRVMGLPVIFVSFCHGRDSQIAQDILQSVTSADSNFIDSNLIVDNLDYIHEGIIELLRNAEFVVGMRLHAVIFSMLAQTKFISLVYSSKVKGFLKLSGLERLGIDVDDFTSEKVMQLIEKYMIGSDSIKVEKDIASFGDAAKSKEQKNFKIAESLLE